MTKDEPQTCRQAACETVDPFKLSLAIGKGMMPSCSSFDSATLVLSNLASYPISEKHSQNDVKGLRGQTASLS